MLFPHVPNEGILVKPTYPLFMAKDKFILKAKGVGKG